MKYNKLVRDKIVDIITENGERPNFRIIQGDELIIELLYKFCEEMDELTKAKNEEELADVREVAQALSDALVDNLADFYSLNKKKVLVVQKRKARERGRFKKGIFLESVE